MADDNPFDEQAESPQKLIADCYLLLLRLPYSSPIRHAAQGAMAQCVNYLAAHSGLSEEIIQTACEREAARYHIENLKGADLG